MSWFVGKSSPRDQSPDVDPISDASSQIRDSRVIVRSQNIETRLSVFTLAPQDARVGMQAVEQVSSILQDVCN